ncbi:MAG: ATP-binding cassette domain-containing protein [Gammaproteobacteria bacterium]|nr:ATP-binding cassette domain-containing protein [Gammaproteobacteria bacterium]
MSGSLLELRDVAVEYDAGGAILGRRRKLRAVDGVTFELDRGATLGIVGESGCGKSTLARAILGLVPLARGAVILNGEDLAALKRRALRARRKTVQLVFQDPLGSLDPRMTAGEIIAEPLGTFYPALDKTQRTEQVRAMMGAVGLSPAQFNRYPHELSGGQCQRIGIARALIVEPELLVCDEPVSALDASIQAQIVNLLESLQASLGLAMLFIAHDLRIVRHLCDRVMVMYLGRVMEIAGSAELFARPRHPYTRALLDASPVPDPQRERARARIPLAGELPSAVDPPSGCVFRTRCPYAQDRCIREVPALRPVGAAFVACHFTEEIFNYSIA